MTASVLDMSMSLDGFVAGLGDGVERLHEWLFVGAGDNRPREAIRRLPGVNGRVARELMATGAVVAGRGTFEPAGGWGGDHHDGVPIFILSRDPAGLGEWPLVTYVDDVTAAMAAAKQAANGRDVLVHGAGTAQLALAAGVLDEIELHLVPTLLGAGRRLFEDLPRRRIELELTRVLPGEGGITHLRYRVLY